MTKRSFHLSRSVKALTSDVDVNLCNPDGSAPRERTKVLPGEPRERRGPFVPVAPPKLVGSVYKNSLRKTSNSLYTFAEEEL